MGDGGLEGKRKEQEEAVGACLKSLHTLATWWRSLIARFSSAFFRFCNLTRLAVPNGYTLAI